MSTKFSIPFILALSAVLYFGCSEPNKSEPKYFEIEFLYNSPISASKAKLPDEILSICTPFCDCRGENWIPKIKIYRIDLPFAKYEIETKIKKSFAANLKNCNSLSRKLAQILDTVQIPPAFSNPSVNINIEETLAAYKPGSGKKQLYIFNGVAPPEGFSKEFFVDLEGAKNAIINSLCNDSIKSFSVFVNITELQGDIAPVTAEENPAPSEGYPNVENLRKSLLDLGLNKMSPNERFRLVPQVLNEFFEDEAFIKRVAPESGRTLEVYEGKKVKEYLISLTAQIELDDIIIKEVFKGENGKIRGITLAEIKK